MRNLLRIMFLDDTDFFLQKYVKPPFFYFLMDPYLIPIWSKTTFMQINHPHVDTVITVITSVKVQ